MSKTKIRSFFATVTVLTPRSRRRKQSYFLAPRWGTCCNVQSRPFCGLQIDQGKTENWEQGKNCLYVAQKRAQSRTVLSQLGAACSLTLAQIAFPEGHRQLSAMFHFHRYILSSCKSPQSSYIPRFPVSYQLLITQCMAYGINKEFPTWGTKLSSLGRANRSSALCSMSPNWEFLDVFTSVLSPAITNTHYEIK